jgi:hypothetical protein
LGDLDENKIIKKIQNFEGKHVEQMIHFFKDLAKQFC